jgi:hypothetical protein
MPSYKPFKAPLASTSMGRKTRMDTSSTTVVGLSALLKLPPKRTMIQSREIVSTNKGDILKALRRGHRIADIAQALSIPIRTFVRRLKEQNISARSVHKQYRRSS